MTASGHPRDCDPAAAIQRLGGNESLYAEVVRNFLFDSRDVLSRVQVAIVAGDGLAVHRIAHNFKGSAGLCGATRVVEICERLEKIGLDFDAAKAAEETDNLVVAMATAGDELSRYLA